MIIINRPQVLINIDKVRFQSRIIDEANNFDEDIWYETSSSNACFFDEYNADGFLVLMLLSAIKSNQDIKVIASVSEKLLYGINNYIFPILRSAFSNESYPKVIVERIVKREYSPNANATGCSLGVDSFSSILHHTSEKCMSNYRLSHLTFFNVGAIGTYYNSNTELSFFKNLEMISKVAKIINLPVIWVNSNLHICFKEHDFNATHTFRNMSVVLSMPKLFEKYFYASGYSYKDYKIDKGDWAKFEDVILSHISTETTFLYSDDSCMTRFEKTKYIKDSQLVQKHLYVCLKDQIKNDKADESNEILLSHTLNCSRCEKCLRTLLTLDILGVISSYNNIFDLDYYYRVKPLYIAKVISQKKKFAIYKDLYERMKSIPFSIPIMSYLLAPAYNVYLALAGFKIQKIILGKIRR